MNIKATSCLDISLNIILDSLQCCKLVDISAICQIHHMWIYCTLRVRKMTVPSWSQLIAVHLHIPIKFSQSNCSQKEKKEKWMA